MPKKPFTYAHASILVGDQGSGKTCSGVARAIDAGINSIVGLKRVSDGITLKASPLSLEQKKDLKAKGYNVTYDTVLVHFPEGKRVMRIPSGYIIIPQLNIFTNFHLFGIRYWFRTLEQILWGLEHGQIMDGRLLMDEYQFAGSARDGMTRLGKALYKYSFTYRKRHLDVDIMCATERLADWPARVVVTERIMCSANPDNPAKITLVIKGKGKPQREFSYNGSQYWKYFFTDELPRMPAGQLAKAMAGARYSDE